MAPPNCSLPVAGLEMHDDDKSARATRKIPLNKQTESASVSTNALYLTLTHCKQQRMTQCHGMNDNALSRSYLTRVVDKGAILNGDINLCIRDTVVVNVPISFQRQGSSVVGKGISTGKYNVAKGNLCCCFVVVVVTNNKETSPALSHNATVVVGGGVHAALNQKSFCPPSPLTQIDFSRQSDRGSATNRNGRSRTVVEPKEEHVP